MQHTLRRGFSSLSSIARSHDDLPAFNAAYWVLTLLAAMLFNAGAFMMLIAGHMALDVVKYRDIHGRKWLKVAEGVARENLIDVSVVALGVAFAVYCHTALPIVAGLRGILRTEIAIISGVVQVLAKTHVLHGFLTILADIHAYLEKEHFRMGKSLSAVEIVSVVGLAASLALIVVSPILLGLNNAEVAHLAAELFIPWNL
jgi:hypothetical protein